MVKHLTTKKIYTYQRLIQSGFDRVKVLTFFLDTVDTSKSDVARECKVTPAFVTMVLSGKRDSLSVKNAISKAIGFNPWNGG